MVRATLVTGFVASTLGTVLLTLAHAAIAQGKLSATDAWIKLPAAGETSTVAFAVVDNPTMYDVYVTGAVTEIAGRVQLRESGPGGAPPTEVKEATAPAYSKLELTASGVHLLLLDLVRPLKEGDVIPLTVLTDGPALSVSATVRK
jgi:hypothetical protein